VQNLLLCQLRLNQSSHPAVYFLQLAPFRTAFSTVPVYKTGKHLEDVLNSRVFAGA